ncbi:MAG: potassium channel protein [Flavobacteriales bacterium]|nr:MAG: potassium channel protein [Flavobacteriales bacterium]
MDLLKSKIYRALLVLLLIIIVGVTGYMTLSDDSFVNSLYMTVITITTVGFSEVHPLSPEEKMFTIFLILMSVITIGYLVSILSEYIASGELAKKIKIKTLKKKINKLQNHTIVCGYGRNGKQAVSKLKKHNKDVLVIESEEKHIPTLDKNGVLYIIGDATHDEVLKNAGIDKAESLIATLPSDADNLYIVLSARQFNDKLTIVSRATTNSSDGKLRIAGADNVIMPYKLGGDHMASLLVTPNIIEFVDKLSINGNENHLQEIVVGELPKAFLSKSIRDLDLRNKTGCSVIGFKTDDNRYLINPDADTKLTINSKLIVLGAKEQFEKLNKLF